MPESLRDLVVSLSLNTDNFTRNIKSVGKQIQEAESYFKLASAGVKDFETTSVGLGAKLETLERNLSLQKDVVEQYERALVSANAKLTECYNRQTDYSQRLTDAKLRQSALQSQEKSATQVYQYYKLTLGETDSATIAAEQNMERAAQEYNDATEEVKKLSGQCDALKKSSQNAADAVSTAQTQLNKAKATVRETEAAIKDTSKELRVMQSEWTTAGKALTEFSERCNSLGRITQSLGSFLNRYLTTPILALGTTSVKASLDFESSFASVRKTVDATEEEFDALAQTSKRMSTQVAASTSTINEVMATGGQLGIATEHLEDFTKVMIDLDNSCEDLNADEAATAIAKFANVMGADQSKFSNIGSTIVDLGNNFATTEKPIMEMSQRLAGAGKQVGLTEAQVLGFAAGLSSVGIEAQMGGSAFSKALIKMEVAAETGSDELADFANICGLTEEEFKKLFDSDPAAAFMSFIAGLSKLDEEGESAIAVLDEIGIKEVRLRDTLLRSVNATELFQSAQDRANRAWDENNALTIEANKRYATTSSKLQNLKNKAMLAGQQIGDDLNPAIQNIMQTMSEWLDKFMELDEAERAQIEKWALIAAASGPAILLFSKVTKGIGSVTGALGKFMTSVGQAGGGFSGLMSVLGKSPAVWLAVASAVAYGTYQLIDYATGAKALRGALEDLQKTANQWAETGAKTFYNQAEGLSAFGMSTEDFSNKTAKWLRDLSDEWSDNYVETDSTISKYSDSFKELSDVTRDSLKEMVDTARDARMEGFTRQVQKDIETLDGLDQAVEELLQKKQERFLTDEDFQNLERLVQTRDEIRVRYHLQSDNVDGFDTLEDQVAAAVSRAQARGWQDSDISIYQNAMVAAAQGMAAVNQSIDDEYDKRYAIISLMEDQEAELQRLNEWYNRERLAAGKEYADTLGKVLTPILESDAVEETYRDMSKLYELVTRYQYQMSDENYIALADFASGLNQDRITEYYGILTQIQSLMDQGLGASEIAEATGVSEEWLSTAFQQVSGIQQILSSLNYDEKLSPLSRIFSDLGSEALKIATDLDMTGARARWDEFAQNPGAITAVLSDIPNDITIPAFSPVTLQNVPESITVSATSPVILSNVPDSITVNADAQVSLTHVPESITVAAQSPVSLTNIPDSLTVSANAPVTITGLPEGPLELDANAPVTLQNLPESITVSCNSPVLLSGVPEKLQVGCDSPVTLSGLPKRITVGCDSPVTLSGIPEKLSLECYSQFQLLDVPKEVVVPGKVNLSSIDQKTILKWKNIHSSKLSMSADVTPQLVSDAFGSVWFAQMEHLYNLGKLKVYGSNGLEIEVSPKVLKKLDQNDLVVGIGEDGIYHIQFSLTPTGTEEAIAEVRETLSDSRLTDFGKIFAPELDTSTFQYVEDALKRIETYKNPGFFDFQWLNSASGNLERLKTSMETDFSPTRTQQISQYVSEIMTAYKNGQTVSDEDIQRMRSLSELANELDALGIGRNILNGIQEGMTAAEMDTSAETVASDLENALNAAFGIASPSKRMMPIGSYIAEGIGNGMMDFSYSSSADAVYQLLYDGLNQRMSGSAFYSVGQSISTGIAAGILSEQNSIQSAIRKVATDAVNAAKLALDIHSPSGVFRREVGVMAMRGIGEGVLSESKQQQKIIANAMYYLTKGAKQTLADKTNSTITNHYNTDASISFPDATFSIMDETDIHALAIEIASFTKRIQHGKG